jgi:hypothetical protein
MIKKRGASWLAEWHTLANYLLLAAMLVVYVAHFFSNYLGTLAKQILEGPNLTILVLLYVVLITSRVEALRNEVDIRMTALAENRLDECVGRIDPVMQNVLGDYITQAARNVTSAALKQCVEFRDLASLTMLYQKVLKKYTGHTFYAVTRPSKRFWQGSDIYTYMEDFTASGGTIQRLFVIEGALTEDDKSVINRHIAARIQVATISSARLDGPDCRNFLVESKGKIGWWVTHELVEAQQRLVATSDVTETKELIVIFRRVWALSAKHSEQL